MAKGNRKSGTKQADAGADTTAQQKPDEETAGQDGQPPADQETAGQDGQPPADQETAGQDDTPAPDDGGGAPREGKVAALRVTAKADRFYRCGLKFGRAARTIAIYDLEPDHVKRIEAEPRLVAHRVEVDASEVEVLNR